LAPAAHTIVALLQRYLHLLSRYLHLLSRYLHPVAALLIFTLTQ
jgi:hypothetical protein